MKKKVEISALLASQLLGQNVAFDALIKANFTESELNISIQDRIKTVADAVNFIGMETENDFILRTSHLAPHKIALEKLEVITLALNEGKEMRYDETTYLYYPYFRVSKAGAFSFRVSYYARESSFVSSRLCFLSAELATYAGEQFIDIYQAYLNS